MTFIYIVHALLYVASKIFILFYVEYDQIK